MIGCEGKCLGCAQLEPVSALAALDGAENEAHSGESVVDGREVEVQWLGRFSRETCADHAHRVRIDIGERLEKSFGMSRGKSRRVLRGWREKGMTGLVHFHWRVGVPHEKNVRLLLLPLERALRAVHAQRETILFAERDLRAKQKPLCSTPIPDEN